MTAGTLWKLIAFHPPHPLVRLHALLFSFQHGLFGSSYPPLLLRSFTTTAAFLFGSSYPPLLRSFTNIDCSALNNDCSYHSAAAAIFHHHLPTVQLLASHAPLLPT
jgi:hypothetical protein